jgi:serine/threonine protein kinase
MIGTMLYMAPETLNPTEEYSYDSKVDVWSLGIIFYELLTGKLLYKGNYNYI